VRRSTRMGSTLALTTLAAALAGCGAQAQALPRAAAAQAAKASAPCGLTPERLAALGARVPMGAMTTVYPHSPPGRNQNMAVAAQSLCGRVLAPGQTLSFNRAIGETTEARGYTYGPTFVGNRVVPGLGGGVCQVATTLYDAARKAGIQVLERHNHGMRVPYVPPGEDATVFSPSLDLVIRNSTKGPLVVVAESNQNRVTIRLVGTEKPPRTAFRHEILSTTPFETIRIADPSLPRGTETTVQEGVDGTVSHTWYVIQREGEPERVIDLGVDHYRPSPHVVRYGTGAASPAPSRAAT
jgi:vancomycin resistance protein VanW